MDDLTDDEPIVPAPPASSTVGRNRRWITTGIAVVAFLAAGALLVKGLTDATLFFRNADEAVAQRDSLGDKRFNLQGLVVDGTVRQQADLVLFAVEFNDVQVDVAHQGAPPQLFQEGIPVVLEGSFVSQAAPDGTEFTNVDGTAAAGYHYRSDRILVKHDENYEADNGERLDDGRRGSTE